jgi:hypothetical protein
VHNVTDRHDRKIRGSSGDDAVASVPRGVTLTLIFSAMPSRGKRSVVSQIPLVLPGIATVLALSRTCLKASTVLTSGFEVPARTATTAKKFRTL